MLCGNDDSYFVRVVKDHLFVNGIDVIWSEHGEATLVSDSDSDNGMDTDSSESVQVTPRKSKKAASNKITGSASATISTASKRKKSKNHDEEESEKGLKLLKHNCVAMKRISKSRSLKQKRVAQFNRTGTPYGKATTEMKSYIGVLARQKIPIDLRKTQQARRRMNKYPHRLPRKGYVGLVAELKAKAKPTQAEPEETSTISNEDELYDRCETWVTTHVTKEGNFADEETQKKARDSECMHFTKVHCGQISIVMLNINKIKLKKKISTGETSLSGYNDVLEKALGKDHGGRVRGVADFVNPTTYFHLPRRNNRQSIEETIKISLEKLLAEQTAKIIEETRKKTIEENNAFSAMKFETYKSQFTPDNGNGGQAGRSPAGLEKPIPPVSGQASCSNTADIFENDMHDQVQAPNAQAEIEEVTEKNIKGQVEVNDQVEGNNEPGVTSTLIFKCLKAMEVTCEEVSVMLALGSLDNIVATGTSMKTDDLYQLCHDYPLGDQNVLVSIEIAKLEYAKVPFPMGDDITTQPQKKREKRGVPIEIIDLKADALNAPIQLKMLCMWGVDELKMIRVLSFFIERLRYLYDVLKNTKMLDMIVFVDPAMVGEGCGTTRSKDQHWVLTVVEPEKEKVYYMDPLRRQLPIASVEWMFVINRINKLVYTQDD
ncbi:hypothetical protein ACLB2K_007534 [Fragaria x ananassa]